MAYTQPIEWRASVLLLISSTLSSKCSNSTKHRGHPGNHPPHVIDSPPETYQIPHLAPFRPPSTRQRTPMLHRTRQEDTGLRHLEPFILQQTLDFPLAGSIDARLHVQERNGENAEDGHRRYAVHTSSRWVTADPSEVEIGECSRSDQRRHPVRAVLVAV